MSSWAAGSASGGSVDRTLIFPTLQPFAEPPPLPSVPLSAAEALAVLGADANRTIYEEPDPVLREGGARFRLSLAYRVRVEGLALSFNLGAFGIREGSEKVTVDGRTLRRGIDYTIDYQLGIVTLNNPQAIFGANPDAEIQATWEQKAAFQIAPTSLYGLSARYDLGTTGEINLLGLYQAEKAIVNRPQLGLEPGAIFLGGASGDLRFEAGWLDRLLAFVPGLRDSPGSSLRLTGELGVSVPDPNRRGDTFLDDFEATDGCRSASIATSGASARPPATPPARPTCSRSPRRLDRRTVGLAARPARRRRPGLRPVTATADRPADQRGRHRTHRASPLPLLRPRLGASR